MTAESEYPPELWDLVESRRDLQAASEQLGPAWRPFVADLVLQLQLIELAALLRLPAAVVQSHAARASAGWRFLGEVAAAPVEREVTP